LACETLTSNRDGLRYIYASALSDLLTALAVDKKSALREQRAEYKRYAGEKAKHEAKQPKAAEGDLAKVIQMEQIAAALVKCSGGASCPVPITAYNSGIQLVVTSKEDESDKTITVGPEFILKNTTGLKTPVHYTPGESFSKYSKELVSAWTACLLKLHQVCNRSGEFSVAARPIGADRRNTLRR
jgi:hypothetical protein